MHALRENSGRGHGLGLSVHPLRAKKLRALRRLLRETPEGQRATYLFVSERVAPLSVAGYQRMVARAGRAAGFRFLVHSHMLRLPPPPTRSGLDCSTA